MSLITRCSKVSTRPRISSTCTLQSSPHCVESSWTPTTKLGICSQVQLRNLSFYIAHSLGKSSRKSNRRQNAYRNVTFIHQCFQKVYRVTAAGFPGTKRLSIFKGTDIVENRRISFLAEKFDTTLISACTENLS